MFYRIITTVLLLATSVAAQVPCPGDLNGDVRVEINELVAAVGASLDGCPEAPPHCPFTFDQLSTNQYCRYVFEYDGCTWLAIWETMPPNLGIQGLAVNLILAAERGPEYTGKTGDHYVRIVAASTSMLGAGAFALEQIPDGYQDWSVGSYLSASFDGTILHVNPGYSLTGYQNTGQMRTHPVTVSGCRMPSSARADFVDVFTAK